MDTSAESLRERNKRETSRTLTDAARRLTAEKGFGGFTVEELCSEVGVSRRTFFNYFASKENAVFGFAVIDSRQQKLEERFVAQSGDLLDDFVDLTITRFELFNPVHDARALFAVIDTEPRLFKALLDQFAESERRDANLVVQRLGEGPDAALRAEVLVQTVGALLRLSMDQLLHHQSPVPFRELLTSRLAIARSLLTTSEKAD
ncbi:TetR/AcrR family transcriptional regulator [Microbacterium sp. ZW T5_45]|uniref:TetR/AcrR family transcriptional regulator n=1 Tax=Microbacterium sp. ZW T5_45 TaxID=3378080 RepID=UPI0038549145